MSSVRRDYNDYFDDPDFLCSTPGTCRTHPDGDASSGSSPSRLEEDLTTCRTNNPGCFAWLTTATRLLYESSAGPDILASGCVRVAAG
ncbi:hypothetical protein AB1N83_001773 [Pleurotus pulmonarius]